MKKNKGFTLVEVIVILVILAILAAVLIPSLTTYIDKAREKNITANARAAYVAAQAIASEKYGTDSAWATNRTSFLTNNETDILKLAQLKKADGTDIVAGADIVTCTVDEKGTITAFEYKETASGTKNAVWTFGTGAWVMS